MSTSQNPEQAPQNRGFLPVSHSPQGSAQGFRAGRRVIHDTLSLSISFKTMETCEDGDDLVFFYQVCEGIAKASHASHTAAQAGLPDQLLTRGKEVRAKGQTPLSGLPTIVTAPLRSLAFWSMGFLTIFFPFSYPTPSPPPPTPHFLLPGLRLDPQRETHKACQGVAKGEANGKVSLWTSVLVLSSMFCSSSPHFRDPDSPFVLQRPMICF